MRVNWLIATVAPLLIEKIRESLLPLTASMFAPGPSMVRLPVISISPLVRTIVPGKTGLNSIVSLPAAALALTTASRNEPKPSSLRLVTVKVDACATGKLKIANKIKKIYDVGGGN
ncbi:MAG: hypothetical protein LAE24_04540 [Candidatus Contendobacter sp.]|nr:hypothetical protein [Candidatus Contendobacter sp.]